MPNEFALVVYQHSPKLAREILVSAGGALSRWELPRCATTKAKRVSCAARIFLVDVGVAFLAYPNLLAIFTLDTYTGCFVALRAHQSHV